MAMYQQLVRDQAERLKCQLFSVCQWLGLLYLSSCPDFVTTYYGHGGYYGRDEREIGYTYGGNDNTAQW